MREGSKAQAEDPTERQVSPLRYKRFLPGWLVTLRQRCGRGPPRSENVCINRVPMVRTSTPSSGCVFQVIKKLLKEQQLLPLIPFSYVTLPVGILPKMEDAPVGWRVLFQLGAPRPRVLEGLLLQPLPRPLAHVCPLTLLHRMPPPPKGDSPHPNLLTSWHTAVSEKDARENTHTQTRQT